MKRLISLSLLALMLCICVIQPVSAYENKAESFKFGFISGSIPVIGALFKIILDQQLGFRTTLGEDISFVAGHALGITLWPVALYLGYRELNSNSDNVPPRLPAEEKA